MFNTEGKDIIKGTPERRVKRTFAFRVPLVLQRRRGTIAFIVQRFQYVLLGKLVSELYPVVHATRNDDQSWYRAVDLCTLHEIGCEKNGQQRSGEMIDLKAMYERH